MVWRVPAAGGVLAAVVLAGTAAALPNADKMTGASAHGVLRGTGETFVIDVYARQSEAGSSLGRRELLVSVKRCRANVCDQPDVYRRTLAAGDLVVAPDQSSASLRTSLFGQPLVIEWTAAGDTSASSKADFYQPVLPTGRVRAWVRADRATSARITVLGRRCTDPNALVFTEALVDGVADPVRPEPPRSVPARFKGLDRATCS